MKLLPAAAWLIALKEAWRVQRRTGEDPADMGTAFGLDSITVIEFDPTVLPDAGPSTTPHWQRRLERRSRF
ncbi:MAG: hypothetical protein ABI809_01605 [Caldimonas sp.]